MVFKIEDLKDKFIAYFKTKNRNGNLLKEFKLSELLNINTEVSGFKISIPFKLFSEYHTRSHEFYDVLLMQKSYRDKLGQQ